MQRLSFHDQATRKCIHFNGVNNKTCKAGVKYSDVEYGLMKYPCLKSGGECSKAKFLSHEDLGLTDKSINMKPTVTDLIDLLNKPALLKWANKIGLEGVSLDDYRNKAKSEGDNKHKLIENDFKHGIVYENELFQKFKSKYEVVAVEPVIECEFYKGRADVLLKRDNLLWLFDFKNSNNIYFEQKLQLVAYKRVLKCDKIGIVNTTYFTENIVDLTAEQENAYTKILSALTVIWNMKRLL